MGLCVFHLNRMRKSRISMWPRSFFGQGKNSTAFIGISTWQCSETYFFYLWAIKAWKGKYKLDIRTKWWTRQRIAAYGYRQSEWICLWVYVCVWGGGLPIHTSCCKYGPNHFGSNITISQHILESEKIVEFFFFKAWGKIKSQGVKGFSNWQHRLK